MVASIMCVGFCIGIGISYTQDFEISNKLTSMQDNAQEISTSSDATSSKENVSNIPVVPVVPSEKQTSSAAAPSSAVDKPIPKPKPKPVTTPPKTASTASVESKAPPPSASNNVNAEMENIIFQKVNELRSSLGLHEYVRNSKLDSSAHIRSNEMLVAGLFSHTRPDSTSCFTAIEEVGYDYQTCGENIAYCSGYSQDKIAETLFNGWLKSPGHYAAMVSPNFKEIGISVCGDSAMAYGTQHFGAQR